jgi:hypothetical protein
MLLLSRTLFRASDPSPIVFQHVLFCSFAVVALHIDEVGCLTPTANQRYAACSIPPQPLSSRRCPSTRYLSRDLTIYK